MTKSELVKEVAEKLEMKKADAEAAVETVLGSITAKLVEGDRVTLKGFGSFFTKDKPARKGRNPKTGGEVDIPARTAVKFTAAKDLKEVCQK